MSADLRPLDHLVLPVADLNVAEQRYAALGFTVAPRGRHPFGTENACVFFSDDTFLEPLAVADRQEVSQAVAAGNCFVGHDATYRTRVGSEGLSAIVYGAKDAKADQDRFVREGISAGDMLRFSRPFKGTDGSTGEATFLLAFAKDLRAPDTLFFSCERVGVPSVDHTPLTRHPNGAQTLARVILFAPEPEHFEMLLTTMADGAKPVTTPHGFDVPSSTTTVSVIGPDGMVALFGADWQAPSDPTLQAVAVEFAVWDLTQTEAVLRERGVAFRQTTAGLLVASAPGQGVPFIFKDMTL